MEELHLSGEAGLISGDVLNETVVHKMVRNGNLEGLKKILSFEWLVREANRRPNLFNFPAVLPFPQDPKTVASPRLLEKFKADVRAAYVLMRVLRIQNQQKNDVFDLARLSQKPDIQNWLEDFLH